MMPHRGLLIAWVALLLGSPLIARADRPVPVHPSCLLTWMEGAYTCFAPFRADQAEERMPVTPVDPVTVVTKLSGLQLDQVITLIITPGNRPSQASAVSGIFYVFGQCPCDLFPPAPQADYVIVSEIVAGGPNSTSVDRDSGQVTTPQSGTKTYYGPWHLTTGIPGRKLRLEVEATLSRDAVEAIGQALLNQAAHDVMH